MICSLEINLSERPVEVVAIDGPLGNDGGGARVRFEGDFGDIVIALSDKDLRRLAVCIVRHLREEPEGCFINGKFLIGIGDKQKQFPAQEILEQYPL